MILLVSAYIGGLYIAISSAGAAIWPRRPAAASGAFSCSGSDLACWDFSGADTGATTGNCDGETGNPSDTIDFACTDGDCECDAVTDGSEVFEFVSDVTNCAQDTANALGWDAAWPSEADNVTYISGCLKVTSGTLDGHTIAQLRNGTADYTGLGGDDARIKVNMGANDALGMTCAGNGTAVYGANNTLAINTWTGFTIELDDSTGNMKMWIDDDTSGGDTDTTADVTCSGVSADTTFDGFKLAMCESDGAFTWRLDNLRITESNPGNVPTDCGAS